MLCLENIYVLQKVLNILMAVGMKDLLKRFILQHIEVHPAAH